MGNLIELPKGFMLKQSEKEVFLNRIMSLKYKSFYNHFIKKNVDKLMEVAEDIKCGDYEAANTKLEALYKSCKLDKEDKDNWFCYELATKIVEYCGLTNKITYADE